MNAKPIKCPKGGYCQSKGNGSLICKKCNNQNEKKCKYYKPNKKKRLRREVIKRERIK